MFGGLKDKFGADTLKTSIDKFSPVIQEHIKKVTSLKAGDIRSDETYKSIIISPALIAASAASSGATKLIPNFDVKFTNALLNVRKELVKFDTDKVSLVDGYEKRLPEVLLQGFKE